MHEFAFGMSDSLRLFVNEVFSSRHRIPNANAVYNMYNAVVRNNDFAAGLDWNTALTFLEELWRFQNARHGVGNLLVQDYDAFDAGMLIASARQADNNIPLAPGPLTLRVQQLGGIQADPQLPGVAEAQFLKYDLISTFYHFMNAATHGATRYRVYVNVQADDALDLMQYIVNHVVDAIAGVSEAKVAGPIALQTRTDTIVIYTTSATAQQAVVTELDAFQQIPGNVGMFIDRVPALTERQLPGVSTATEPDQVELRDGGRAGQILGFKRQSFGGLRADLIYKALHDAGNDAERFFDLVVKYFRRAGLDPKRPNAQSLRVHSFDI